MRVLENAGIPAVFRAGPDLFAQPEVLLFAGILGRAVAMDQYRGRSWGPSLPHHIATVLQCNPTPDDVITAACRVVTAAGLPLPANPDAHLRHVAALINKRLENQAIADDELRDL